ncbi:MAG: hypothetical protein AAF512_18965 [Pseudomonadota bacterium]
MSSDNTAQSVTTNNVVYVPTLEREPRGHLNIPTLVNTGVLFGVGTDDDQFYAELQRMQRTGMPATE